MRVTAAWALWRVGCHEQELCVRLALELLGTGQVAVADLITCTFPLAEIHAALDVLRQGAAIKVTIEP